MTANELLTFSAAVHQFVDLFGRAVVNSDPISAALRLVPGFTHHRQTDKTEVTLFAHDTQPFTKTLYAGGRKLRRRRRPALPAEAKRTDSIPGRKDRQLADK